MTHLKRPWCWERLKVGGEGDNRGWDGWMASPTQWTGVNSGSWCWTGKPGMLQSMGLQIVGHDWATELNWTDTEWIEEEGCERDNSAVVGTERVKWGGWTPWPLPHLLGSRVAGGVAAKNPKKIMFHTICETQGQKQCHFQSTIVGYSEWRGWPGLPCCWYMDK